MIEASWTESKLSHEIPHVLNGGQDTTQIQVERTGNKYSIGPSRIYEIVDCQRLVVILGIHPMAENRTNPSCAATAYSLSED